VDIENMDRAAMKTRAKEFIKTTKPSPMLATLAYLVITILISSLISMITGLDKLVEKMTSYVQDGGVLTTEKMLEFYNFDDITVISLIIVLVLWLCSAMLESGYIWYSMLVSRSRPAPIMSMFESFTLLWKIIVLGIIRNIIVSIGFILIIPGVILAYSYSQALPVLFDDPDIGPIEALRRSRRMMKGHKFEYFELEISFIGWVLIGSFVEGLIGIPLFNLWLSPYMTVTQMIFYNNISGWKDDARDPEIIPPVEE